MKLDLVSVARATTGWSGADLSNLVNEAALAAVTKDVTLLTTDLLTNAKDKIIMGLPRRCVRPSALRQQLLTTTVTFSHLAAEECFAVIRTQLETCALFA